MWIITEENMRAKEFRPISDMHNLVVPKNVSKHFQEFSETLNVWKSKLTSV